MQKLKVHYTEETRDDLVGLKNLGTDCTVISDETLTVCFKFIGLLYGEATSNLNHLRYKLFTEKNLESRKLPPTEDSALHHVGELDSPARPLALVKMNAATSEKMTKTMNFNPLYQFEL